MPLLPQHLLCPFCFADFPPGEVRFRCINPSCTGQAPDQAFGKLRGGGAPVMGHVVTPPKASLLRSMHIPDAATCDVCQMETRTRLCAECHFQLPHDVGQIDQRIIAIIGGRNTGKSHYIVTLVNRLRNEVGANFNFAVHMIGEDTRRRWKDDFYGPLYEQRTVLQATRPGAVDARVKAPLIFRLTLEGTFGKRAINLSFFDTAGEDMKSVDNLSVQARYITHADGIIFLLDPLQIPAVRQQLPHANLPVPDRDAAPDEIVERLLELFETQLHLRQRDRIKVPIAFTISKVDALFPILDPSSAIRNQENGQHFGALDLRDINSVSGEMRDYLSAWIGSGFCNDIEKQFTTYNYFAVSSLGEPPGPDQRLRTVAPFRVEDPFLWILYQLNLIKATKGR
ncbi:MAG TPA: hypothetical protein VF116_01200 [Ktedonobacterales bacterium]